MKHMKMTIAFVFVIAVAISAILGYVNSLTFKSIDQVVAKEFGSMRGEHNAMDDGMFFAIQARKPHKLLGMQTCS